MSRQGQFLTMPCRCSRTQEFPSPNGRSPRNDYPEVDFQNSARSRKRSPETNEELWSALSALREKTSRYRSKMEGNEFQQYPSPQCGGSNVLRKANDLIDYVPESEFLRKMKQQCRFLNSNEPNIFSALDEVTDDKDFERSRRATEYGHSPQRLSYSPRGNENYSPEATGDLPCYCQQHQGQDKKSEHVSRNKKRVTGGRRKRKSGSAGTIESGDQFQPSLKKPYENSCPRCWRFASPARSPVNKPDQKFDPNFRRAHSCATFEGREDFGDLQVHDQSVSPCYRSKSIPSGASGEKSPARFSNASSGHSPPRSANGAVRFSQPRTSSPGGPDLQISTAKPVQDTRGSPSSPRGSANYVTKGAQDCSPGRYSPPPTQYYSPQKPRPDYSPSRAPQQYSPGQAQPRPMQECPQHSSPAKPRLDSSPERRSSPPRSPHDARCHTRPRPVSSPPIATRDTLQVSSPTGSDRQNLSGTIMQEYLPPRCPVHPEVLLQQVPMKQMQCPNQTQVQQVPEHYAATPTRPPREETTYLHNASPRTPRGPHHHTCPKHSPKTGQMESMQRPKPQSFIPGGSSTDVNRCYVSVDQQNAASRGMYAPVEKDQCFPLCSILGQEDDLDVTEYKTFNPKSASSKEQGYTDFSLSRVGGMSPVPEECSYSPRRSTEGSSGAGSHDSTSYMAIKSNRSGSKGNSRENSKENSRDNSNSRRSSKGSVGFAKVKALSKSPGGSSGNKLNKSSSSPSPGSSPSRRKSPPGSQKKGKRNSPSSKNASCKNACGNYVKKASPVKASAEGRICPPVPSSPKEYHCNSCSAQHGTSPKNRSNSPKRNSPAQSPSKQNKPCPPSSPQPGPSGVQRSPQARPQSANLATQNSCPSPRDRPQTAGSSNEGDSSKGKLATKIPEEIYDAGHRVIDCACFPRVQYADPDGPLMCCHCQWQKNELDNNNNPQDFLDCGTGSPKDFEGRKIPCPYRKYAYQKLESSTLSSIHPPGQNRLSLEDSSDLSHSRLLREVNECIQNQNQKPDNSAARKYIVFYMTQSKEPKENNLEVLVEEMSQSCPDKTDERAKDITEKMRKILDNPTDSMALRFQKGVSESRTPRTSRILYF